jgi:hypothetical protein
MPCCTSSQMLRAPCPSRLVDLPLFSASPVEKSGWPGRRFRMSSYGAVQVPPSQPEPHAHLAGGALTACLPPLGSLSSAARNLSPATPVRPREGR